MQDDSWFKLFYFICLAISLAMLVDSFKNKGVYDIMLSFSVMIMSLFLIFKKK